MLDKTGMLKVKNGSENQLQGGIITIIHYYKFFVVNCLMLIQISLITCISVRESDKLCSVGFVRLIQSENIFLNHLLKDLAHKSHLFWNQTTLVCFCTNPARSTQ